jgi:Uma2 family endonuclease
LHLEQYGGGQVYFSPVDVIFSSFDVVEPDLLFVSDARQEILTDTWVYGSPDLVVEILSPSTRRRDEGIKLRLYERFNVFEYWIVDPKAEAFRIYRRRDRQLEQVVELTRSRDEAVTTPLLPGLSLPLAKVFT